MEGVVDLGAGLGGVDLTDIVVKIVFLTVPGLALARGLKRFRTAGGTSGEISPSGRGGRLSAHLQAAGGKLASFATIVAVLLAGLGLVPLAQAGYTMISGVDEMAPAVIGVIVVAVLLAKGFVMAHDLMDGKVDRPHLWLAPVPLLALLIWVAPVVTDQITDQAGQSVQMIVDEAKVDQPGKHPPGKEKGGKEKGGKDESGKDESGKEGPGKGEPGGQGR